MYIVIAEEVGFYEKIYPRLQWFKTLPHECSEECVLNFSATFNSSFYLKDGQNYGKHDILKSEILLSN